MGGHPDAGLRKRPITRARSRLSNGLGVSLGKSAGQQGIIVQEPAVAVFNKNWKGFGPKTTKGGAHCEGVP